MNKEKRQALEAAGWVFGDAEDFLELTREERAMVELRLAVSNAVRTRRMRQGLTQAQAAKILRTSQPRVAQIEAGARDVTLDLMFRGLYALGGTIEDLRTVAPSKRRPARSATRATAKTVAAKRTNAGPSMTTKRIKTKSN